MCDEGKPTAAPTPGTGRLTRERAEALLREAESLNPGPWGDHSRTAARCAERIAAACGMDAEKAYLMGLMHDIGRRCGVKHLAHVLDGYDYMMALGFPDIARACLTHSFPLQTLEEYVGNFDLPDEDIERLKGLLAACEYDDYDRLIQLCDCLAGAGYVMDINARMDDVERRYGRYSPEKRAKNLQLKSYFERRCGRRIEPGETWMEL